MVLKNKSNNTIHILNKPNSNCKFKLNRIWIIWSNIPSQALKISLALLLIFPILNKLFLYGLLRKRIFFVITVLLKSSIIGRLWYASSLRGGASRLSAPRLFFLWLNSFLFLKLTMLHCEFTWWSNTNANSNSNRCKFQLSQPPKERKCSRNKILRKSTHVGLLFSFYAQNSTKECAQ